MFSTYREFKDLLINFHPEKIGYSYNTLSHGWIDDEDKPTFKLTESEGTWILWLVNENLESEVYYVSQNDPLQMRNLLCRLEIIAHEDYWQELLDDSDSF